LAEWERNVENRPKFKTAEKKKMLLSDETLLGLRMTSGLNLSGIASHFATQI
jgi:hypothetical protein